MQLSTREEMTYTQTTQIAAQTVQYTVDRNYRQLDTQTVQTDTADSYADTVDRHYRQLAIHRPNRQTLYTDNIDSYADTVDRHYRQTQNTDSYTYTCTTDSYTNKHTDTRDS